MKRLLLLGAGHAHVAVLAALAQQRIATAEVLLVTPHERQIYSGMVPGLIAGRYRSDECSIAVAPLAAAAGVPWLRAQAVALDAAARQVTLADGRKLDYDVLSLNTGPTQDRDRIPGARAHALFVRPIEAFVQLWQRTRALADVEPLDVVMVGNGAAGVELALAVSHALAGRCHVTLLCDGPLLAQYTDAVRERALRVLAQRGVVVLPGRCSAIQAEHVELEAGTQVACDVPIVATGADAPAWLAGSGLALDDAGFVRVGATLQSASHPAVFAAGDITQRDDAPHPRSGVYAVRAGPPLAVNLRRFIGGGALVTYVPQRRALNLMACGDGSAIASWGSWSAQGRLMGWWKDRIDRAFVARYSVAPGPGPGSPQA